MNEKDLKLIVELKLKAAKDQKYDIAYNLKEAETALRQKLNLEWAETILTKQK